MACEASGKPLPDVAWIRNGVLESSRKKATLLKFNYINRTDTGQYTCRANNSVEVTSIDTTIVVQYKPEGARLTTDAAQNTVTEGDTVTFKCIIMAAVPQVSIYKFYFNGSLLRENSNSEYTLNNVNRSQHYGEYKCIPHNDVGDGAKATVRLNIKVQTVSSTVATSSQTTPAASESTEVYLTATIQGNCSRRSEVAAKFPEMACQIAFKFGCSSANTVNTRCGSVVLDFMMSFNRSVAVSNVLTVLLDAARQDKFGGFKVDPESIKQVFVPTDGSESTTKGPEECTCPSNIVSLAINGVLAFIIVLLIIYIIWLHKKGRTYEDERGVSYNETGLEDSEPSLPDSAKLTQPPAEYMDLIEVNKHDRKAQSTASGADYVPLHPLTRCWEVPRHHVTIEKIIGKGAFGQVAKGTAVGLQGSPEATTVAIKMLKTNATESDKRDLMKELDTMKQLKPHPYVIKLLGCVTESEQLLVLIEYVPFGDLLGYLRKSRGLKDTYFKDPDIKPQTNLTSQQLMKFAWQIADGMSYLSSKSIIHRDLAARNVLVGQKETCKVTDFGMARDVQQENIYERKTKGRLPVKWTAYEALMYGKYTTKSDVWSYGVLLYEIFTIGGSPYPRMDGRKIANLLQEGYRMPKPQHVDEELYQIMMKCWKNDPDARPTFTELKNQLKDMETLHKKLINMTMYDKQLYANVEDLMV
ncbi:unnamed protein product [Pocillopora meandrina]|uniref:receptor protein-tyrosine kinase n=1 Tax=Pocillopora meandrina TaxID=46732 RepID=A0AAU9XSI6_9CNID|nr:unnamed protein product [Pocillopora meandrina]